MNGSASAIILRKWNLGLTHSKLAYEVRISQDHIRKQTAHPETNVRHLTPTIPPQLSFLVTKKYVITSFETMSVSRAPL